MSRWYTKIRRPDATKLKDVEGKEIQHGNFGNRVCVKIQPSVFEKRKVCVKISSLCPVRIQKAESLRKDFEFVFRQYSKSEKLYEDFEFVFRQYSESRKFCVKIRSKIDDIEIFEIKIESRDLEI